MIGELGYTTTFKKLFIEESEECTDGKIYYTNVINENLDPIYPNISPYNGIWKLIHTSVNSEYIFWTWEI
jgi:hypothetical protein